jgi:hypothetical protein
VCADRSGGTLMSISPAYRASVSRPRAALLRANGGSPVRSKTCAWAGPPTAAAVLHGRRALYTHAAGLRQCVPSRRNSLRRAARHGSAALSAHPEHLCVDQHHCVPGHPEPAVQRGALPAKKQRDALTRVGWRAQQMQQALADGISIIAYHHEPFNRVHMYRTLADWGLHVVGPHPPGHGRVYMVGGEPHCKARPSTPARRGYSRVLLN